MKREIKKIAVLRANALGDIIISLPAIKALKNSYPDAEIVLLGRKIHQEILEGRSSVIDRVIPIPESIQFDETIMQNSEAKELFLESVQKERFDLALQLHGGGRYSNSFLKEFQAAWTVGACSEEAPKLDVNLDYSNQQHEILRQLDIIRMAGGSPDTIIPDLHLAPSDLSRSQTWLAEQSLSHTSKPFILINPGASDPRRRWPLENFVALGEKFQKLGYRILFNLSPQESELGQKLQVLKRGDVQIISPPLSILPGLIHLSEMVISNDTGTWHLASALKKKTVVLFWCLNLLTYGPTSFRDKKVLTSWEMQCPECGADCVSDSCNHTKTLLSSISVENVFSAAIKLLPLQGGAYEINDWSFSGGII